ncbi:hypothetical protein ACFQY5_34460 [Paeniroseomonas aquatica]|uniref:CopG family transcriptional regulator n=1 Tax=Paeniroseomonas aquatica TaxID=373043 RepID=A0ABT7ZZW2_9PROT|nr:hypothetical protein [Paeniroseomonas aquatica]MDN3563015.1 hypothetical protein [Paeniroseomonas aquatica]
MAIDASKLKRRLPPPPAPEEGAPGIERQPDPAAAAPEPERSRLVEPPQGLPVLDGRSLRATGRVHQLNVKVTADVKNTILRIGRERGLLVAEVIEQAVEALEKAGDGS